MERRRRGVLARLGVISLLLMGLTGTGCRPAPEPERVRRLLDRGEEEEAERRARLHLAEESSLHGEASLETARALDLVAEARLRRGLADEETRGLAERALALKEGAPEVAPRDLAVSLVQLARARARDDPAAGLPLAERARDLLVAAVGPDDAAVGEALAAEALIRLLRGEAAAGGAAAERSLAIRRQALGPASREIAESLILVSYSAQQSGDREHCVELRREALAMRERLLGPWHPEVGGALLSLGEILLHQQDPEARPVLERALRILERARGPEDRGVLIALNNLALVVQGEGDLQYAKRLYERRLALPGAGGIRDLATWQNLGSALWQLGELRAGREAYEKALSLVEEAGAPPEGLAIHQHNLAFALTLEGRFDEARGLLETAIAAQTAAHGPEDRRVLSGLDALGNLLRVTGDLLGARKLYERALESVARKPDATPGEGATLRFHLGQVRWGLGDLAGARSDLEAAVADMEATGSPDRPDVAVALDVLVDLLLEMGDRQEARRHLLRLRDLHARQQGKRGARVARVEARLAEVEGDAGRRLTMLEIARGRLGAQYGESHPDVAALDVALARALLDAGDADRAQFLLEEARSIQLAVFGPSHPDLARTRIELGKLAADQGDLRKALELALQGERAGLEHLRAAIGGLPEREALGLARSRPTGLDLAASIAARLPGDPEVARAVWSAVIQGRGKVLDEIAARQRLARFARDPAVESLVARLMEARAWLARLLVLGPGTSDPGDYPEKLARARDQAEQAERALAAAVRPLRGEHAVDAASWAEVAAGLPAGTALVAFLRYDAPPERYMAFLQAPGAEPVAVVLGDAAGIDAAVDAWREQVARRPPPGRGSSEAAEAAYRQAGEYLTRLVWAPLAGFLGGAETVFVVPDAGLFRVSLPSLPAGEGSYLIETGPRFHLLAAERDVVGFEREHSPGRGLLAVGAPDFGDAPAASPAASSGSLSAGCRELGALVVPELPGAAGETAAIAALWDAGASEGSAALLTGSAAREESVRDRAPGNRVLHFATHGFFLDRRCSTPGGAEDAATDLWARRVEPGANPLLLSGLALTGFNRRNAVGGETDDGVLTAEEIAALDLEGVEWAVLSACDTGTGAIQDREGVLGLQRAFRTAGVRSIVLSLWPVEDEASRMWMERLYAARAAGTSTVDAVHRAARETLQQRRQLGLGGHPFYWGAFVASGDWR